MAYTKTEWKAREGENLSRFLKTEETAVSVILENAPDSIAEPGTPFSVDNMNKIEQGIADAHEMLAQLPNTGGPAIPTGGWEKLKLLGDYDFPTSWNEGEEWGAFIHRGAKLLHLYYPGAVKLNSSDPRLDSLLLTYLLPDNEGGGKTQIYPAVNENTLMGAMGRELAPFVGNAGAWPGYLDIDDLRPATVRVRQKVGFNQEEGPNPEENCGTATWWIGGIDTKIDYSGYPTAYIEDGYWWFENPDGNSWINSNIPANIVNQITVAMNYDSIYLSQHDTAYDYWNAMYWADIYIPLE